MQDTHYLAHTAKQIWRPVTEECIVCRREPENVEDKNAVAVVKDGFVVGHVPKCFSLWMSIISCKKNSCGEPHL